MSASAVSLWSPLQSLPERYHSGGLGLSGIDTSPWRSPWGRKYQVGYHFRSPLPPPVTTTREMPETIITLPPELIIKVFRSLDHVGTALKLSATCRLLYDVWRSNESMLRMELLPFHPVFWEYYNLAPKPDGPAISLWEYALEYENARQDNDSTNRGELSRAKRIIYTVRTIRNTAREVYWLIDEYSRDAFADYHDCDEDEGEGGGGGEKRVGEETSENWQRYAEWAIGKMLFKILIRLERKEEFDEDYQWDLLELAKFVANHSHVRGELRVGGLPDLRKMVHPQDLSPIHFYQIRTSLWEDLVPIIADEYPPGCTDPSDQ